MSMTSNPDTTPLTTSAKRNYTTPAIESYGTVANQTRGNLTPSPKSDGGPFYVSVV